MGSLVTKPSGHALGAVLQTCKSKAANFLRILMSGGLWTKSSLYHLDAVEDQTCSFCGLTKETAEHLLHDCSALDHLRHREDPALKEIPKDCIPPSLRHGIAPAMDLRLNRTFWGMDVDHLPRATRWLLGSEMHREVRQTEAHHTLQRYKREGKERHSARQYYQLFKKVGKKGKAEVPETQEVKDPAPEEINVYTDGALKNPLHHFWGLVGFGVRWPKRDPATSPLSTAEHQYAATITLNGEIELCGTLTGHCGSSTRSELAAAIIALVAPGPVHIGTDSQAMMETMNKLLAWHETTRRKSKWPLKKPWAMVNDGDLWEQASGIVRQRGPSSVKLTKEKGHST